MKKLILIFSLLPALLFAQADKASWLRQTDTKSGNARVTTFTTYGSATNIIFEANFYPELSGKKILSVTDNRDSVSSKPSRIAVLRVPRQTGTASEHIVSNPDTSEGAQNVVHVVPVAALFPGDKIVLLAETAGDLRSMTIEFQP